MTQREGRRLRVTVIQNHTISPVKITAVSNHLIGKKSMMLHCVGD